MKSVDRADRRERRSQDKFYTALAVAERVTRVLGVLLDALEMPCGDMVALEPSAGAGAFLAPPRAHGFRVDRGLRYRT